MADLPYIQQAQEVKITGQDSLGDTVNYVGADANGNILTKDYSNGSATGGTAATSSILTGGIYNSTAPSLTTGQQASAQLDSSARLITNVGITAPPSNITTTGTLSGLGQTVNLTLFGTASLNIDVSGSGFVGVIAIVANSPSGQRTLGLFNINSSNIASSITTNGSYRVVGIAGVVSVTAQFTSYTSGSATINMYGTTAPFIVQPYSMNAANVLVTSYLNDGSGNALTSTNNALNVSQVSASDTFTTGNITTQDTSSTSTTYFNNQVWYSGTPTTGSVFSVTTAGIETGMVEISGTWTGTLQIEISVDSGVNWITHAIHQIGSPNFITSATNNVTGSLNLGGKTNFRVRAISAITGTAIVRLISSQNPSSTYIANSIKLVDGSTTTSTTTMNIVAASTPAATTNTAIVVGLSPNSPLPAGTNTLGTVNSKTEDGSGNSIASYNSQLDTNDIINTSISSGSITVGTTAVAARVSTSNLTNRKMLMISPVTYTVYLGSSSSVTTTTGIPIYPGQVISFAFSANVTPYLISATSGTVNIFEAA